MTDQSTVEQYTEKETGQKADVLFGPGGAWTPFKLASITGAGVFFLSLILGIGIRISAGLGMVAAGLVWAPYLIHWFNITKVSFMPTVETLTTSGGITQESMQTKAGEPLSVRFAVPTVKDGNYREELYRLPARPSQIQALAERTIAGASFTEGEFIKGVNRIFTPKEFFNLRDYLLSRDLLEQKDPGRPQSGFKWTESGLDLLTRTIQEEVLKNAA